METAVSRIAAFERGSLALTADEMTSTPHGWVARTPSLPVVRSLNQVGVSGPIGLEDALELLELHLGDLPYRQLVLEDEPAGERFAAELGPSGWKVDRNVLMVLTGAPDRGLDTSAVVEADEDDALVLMAAWTAEDEELRSSPAAHRQVLEATRRTWRARNARRFGVRGDDGALAGITMLYSDGQVAQVEDVYLDPSVRGRGLGRALVTHAVVQALDAGHELVFIGGNDNDWPKDLYARVGFEAAYRVWVFYRPPA